MRGHGQVTDVMVAQDLFGTTFKGQIAFRFGGVDWDLPAKQIRNLVRAGCGGECHLLAAQEEDRQVSGPDSHLSQDGHDPRVQGTS